MYSFPWQQEVFQQSSREKSSIGEKKKRKKKSRTPGDPEKRNEKKTGTSRDVENYVAYRPANVDTEAG